MPKQPITTWLRPHIYKHLQDLAGAKGLTVSTLAAELLEQRLKQHAESAGTELVVPVVEATVRRELSFVAERLARLLARSALEAATSRRLLFNVLIQEGLTPQQAKTMNDAAWTRSVESLKQPLAAVQEVAEANYE